jgi:hypothetical protein
MAYIEGQHPRDSKGRWKGKGGTAGEALKEIGGGVAPKTGVKLPGTGRVTVRAGLSSATIMYGRTVPLIPGKINVHFGVLGRIEKAGSGPNFLEKRVDSLIERVAQKLPQQAGDVLRGKKTDIGGVTVGAGKRRRVNPQIRVSNKKKAAGRKVRQPRQPRQRRQR